LETAALTISSTGSPDGLPVALNGALGAFQLFTALNVNNSLFAGVTWDNNTSPGNPVNSTSVALSCPASPTALLSSSPDGFGNVFQDNTIRVTNVISSPASTVTTANVCYGGDQNFGQFTGFPAGTTNCFQAAYEGAAAGFIGDNPDVTVIGEGEGATPFVNVYGVQRLDLMSPPDVGDSGPIFPAVLVPGSQTLKVELLDAGGLLGAATLHLVTNCTASGVTTGGTIVAPPLDKDSPGSLNPTFPFNNTNGQHIQFAANYLNSENTTLFVPNTVPQVADTAVPPASFAALVHGTSAGPAVCMRFNGELDASNQPQCKAFTLTCIIGTGPASGTNCPQSTVRNILFKATFDSIDTPTAQNQIALDTGPGLVMGTDNWVASATNCTFEAGGPLVNQLCPQDALTQFVGGDPIAGGTTRTTNSTFIPVLNMPLPITLPVVTSANFLGCFFPTVLPCWQKSPSVSVKFFASPAIYPFFNPLPANGFMPAPIQSVTFGTNPATAVPSVPDTTYAVPHDIELDNAGSCPLVPGGIFTTNNTTITHDTATQLPFTEGRYILHFFATDCAATEELKFRVNSNPTANWASFKTVKLNIDLHAPTITVTNKVVNTNSHGGTVKLTFNCSDPVLADSTAGSGVVTCGPFLFFAPAHTPSVTSTFSVKIQHGTISLTTTDLAGNSFTLPVIF
jgi:hypothetical protein